MLIAHSSLGQPRRAVALAEIASLHDHAIEPVHQPGQLGPSQLDDRDELDADLLQPLLVGAVARALLNGGIGQLLQPHPGRRLSRPDLLFDLAPGRRLPFGLGARRQLLQPKVPLDRPHQHFLPFVVLGVADHLAGIGDAVGQDVHVLVLGILVASNEVLVVDKVHSAQILASDRGPLLVR